MRFTSNHFSFRYLLPLMLWLFIFGTESKAQCSDPNIAFKGGEVVRYHAYYNWHFVWMNAGEVTFSVKNIQWQKKPAYHITAHGSTYRNYDFFYKVRDTFEVVVDTMRLEPFMFKQVNYEGSYHCHNYYTFNHVNRTIKGRIQKEDEPERNMTLKWHDCSFDLLTMVYRARNIPYHQFAPGTKIPIKMLVDGAIYDLYIRYLGVETIKTRDGRHFRCLKFKPLLVEGTIFKSGEDMTVWVTDDKNRVPIIVEAKVLIGSVKAVFIDAQGLRHPMEAEILN